MFCKNCGKEMKDSAVFCPECGTKANTIELTSAQSNFVEETALPPTEATDKAKEDKKNIIIGLAFIAVIIGIIIFVISLLFGGSDVELDEDSVLSNSFGTISNIEFELKAGNLFYVSGDVTANEFGASSGFIITYSVYDEDDKRIADDTIYTVGLEAGETGAFSGFEALEGKPSKVKITGFYLQY